MSAYVVLESILICRSAQMETYYFLLVIYLAVSRVLQFNLPVNY